MPNPEDYQIVFSYAAIVPPKKTYPELRIISKIFSESEQGYDYFYDLYLKANKHCKNEIIFVSQQNNQSNEIRSILLNILETNDPETKFRNADLLSNYLAEVTDDRNKEGLFVILEGKFDTRYRIMLIRLKGDEGVIKKMEGDTFSIEKPDYIYTSKSKFFKAALFEDEITRSGFWKGLAVDKQVGPNEPKEISDFWIKHFLKSELSINSKSGTLKLSKVFRNLINKVSTLEEKQSLISVIYLLKNREDPSVTFNSIASDLLTGDLGRKFLDEIGDELLIHTPFQIDNDIYNKELGSKITEFENGIIVSTPTFLQTNNIIENKLEEDITEVIIRGKVVNKKVNKKARV